MKYTRRGNFIDSSDGNWTISKGFVYTNAYSLYDRRKGKYVTHEDGSFRYWYYLKDVKRYIYFQTLSEEHKR